MLPPPRRYREPLSFAKIISAGRDGANPYSAGVTTMAADSADGSSSRHFATQQAPASIYDQSAILSP
jgi:hypothetical protein